MRVRVKTKAFDGDEKISGFIDWGKHLLIFSFLNIFRMLFFCFYMSVFNKY